MLLVQNKDNYSNRPGNNNANENVAKAVNEQQQQQRMKHIEDKIAICVKPFHFNYDQALYLIEYIELNSLLGVKHFTFYNHTIGQHATCVLNHYIEGNVPGNLTSFDGEKGSASPQGKPKSGTSTVNNDNGELNILSYTKTVNKCYFQQTTVEGALITRTASIKHQRLIF